MGLHELTKEFWIVLFKDMNVELVSMVHMSAFQNGAFCKWQIHCGSDRVPTPFLITRMRQQINAENDEDV